MSVFLEILKCALCCVQEENPDSNDYESLYGYFSRRTIETSSDSRFDGYGRSVYDVVTKSNSSIEYLPISSCIPATSSYRPPRPQIIASSSRPTQPRPEIRVPGVSYDQSKSILQPKVHFTRPSPISTSSPFSSSKPTLQASASSSTDQQSQASAFSGTDQQTRAILRTRETPSGGRFDGSFTFNSGSSTDRISTSAKPPQPETIASISRPTQPRPEIQVPAVSYDRSQSILQPIVHFTAPSPISTVSPVSSSKPPLHESKLQKVSPEEAQSIKHETHSTKSSSVSSILPSSSSKPSPQATFKPNPTPVSPNLSNQPTKGNFIWVPKNTFQSPEAISSKPLQASTSSDTNQQTSAVLVLKDTSPTYSIPKNLKDLFENDEVPEVLKRPLSRSTYKDYFAALLYAEDYYLEKWSKFKLSDITLKLQEPPNFEEYSRQRIFEESCFSGTCGKDGKTFVAFKVSCSLEERPFLLSRDFVFATPSGSKMEPFQGIINRVVKSTTVLVDFGRKFHEQHYSTSKYDISFAFNRVCLKRAHQAIESASDSLFRNFIFPDYDFRRSNLSPTPPFCYHDLDSDQRSAFSHILNCQGPPPYLIHGPRCAVKIRRELPITGLVVEELSRTGLVIQEAVLGIYRRSPEHRILLCAPINSTCDLLTKKLNRHMPESDIFRANAAFREIDDVPDDILSSCLYKRKDECFACPKLEELQKFRVVLSTYMSSFRLRHEGITPGHFSHVFLLDASSATEPEVMVTLSSLADESTTVIVTGAPGNRPGWVRSSVARTRGLRISYFERISKRDPYYSVDPMFITEL
ncbi:uncharacterized protein LOC126659955 isoform X2 [Mercurialis annua]|uniref:uncharacterized protein LOC126659955 isoform X2 n=1 Tax=Mercurialis annua TaxID=3986 RepID=UPI00215F7131|nr:uncharacterized protein LOC126659955 isoform X2 [Mercurialis annua]